MIVGLLGFIGSGKGTAGDILKDMGFTPVSFAKGVKDVAAEMFGWPRHMLEGDTDASRTWREQPDKFWSKEFGKDFTPRYALQLMGTEVGREIFHEDFWVIRLKKFIQANPNQNFVITDVRFANELQFINDMNGTTIEIERGIPPHWYSVAVQANRGDTKAEKFMFDTGVHESEWRWIGGPIDHKVINSGTVDDLKQNLVKCLRITYGSSIMSELK
jgi:hypothetical protein